MLYQKLLPPSALCFDVGCHLGRKAGAMLKAKARVIGIEPEPLSQRMLEHEFRFSNHFTLVKKGIADTKGKRDLHVGRNLSMTSFRDDWTSSSYTIEVEIDTLDSMIEQYGKPYYIKIDVEARRISPARPVPEGVTDQLRVSH
ncbi:FkbM family methyltransferase [Mucisphaera sp.]|uniref:FkbM family methyltransferase n=1 Tax=Mucisphaera sp. TaxID=2913024 RepID=UPI003D0A8602